MQEKNMSDSGKKSGNRQAPDLFEKIAKHSRVTQKEFASQLGITQQAVSDYQRGEVKKERYDVIKKLQEILNWLEHGADVADTEGELTRYVEQEIDKEAGKPKPTPTRGHKKKTSGPLSPRRNAGH